MSNKRKFSSINLESKVINPDNSYKIILLGNGGIGKSTLFNYLTNFVDIGCDKIKYTFTSTYNATDDFNRKKIKFNLKNGKEIIVTLWDTAGQENTDGAEYRSDYMKGADGILLIYDVENPSSKNMIESWLSDIKKIVNNNSVPVAVIGNKADKLKSKQQYDNVKIRNSVLKTWYNNSNRIKNFLASFRNQTSITINEGYFDTTYTTKRKSCLEGLDYVLSQITGEEIKISY